MSDLDELLLLARRAAAIAGDIVMPLFHSGVTAELKSDRTPVTEADRRAELAIRDFLQRECPGHAVLGEEFPEQAGDGPYRWIIDPIDGTKSFIHKVPLFGTLVAVEHEGVPVVGVIACHAVAETAWAARGRGAYINGEPARVSPVADLLDATVSMTSFSRLAALHPWGFEQIVNGCGLARAWGDCYGYLMVATGRADVMLDPDMSIWDAAALYPVVSEAGGRITTWDGEDRVGDSVIATNGLLHQAVLELFNQDQ